MTDITSIASSALVAFGVKQAVTANNIANIETPDYKASSAVMQESENGGVSAVVSDSRDSVDISKEAVDMITTNLALKANVKVLKTADEMTKELLNVLA